MFNLAIVKPYRRCIDRVIKSETTVNHNAITSIHVVHEYVHVQPDIKEAYDEYVTTSTVVESQGGGYKGRESERGVLLLG